MYTKCFLFLKLFSFATMLPTHNDNNVTRKIILPYPNYISTSHPVTISGKTREQSSDESRVEFQIRNYYGPGTYIFGFNIGHGKDWQYRVEERLRDGSVKGRYGFYDAKGNLKIVHYNAKPNDGYQEQHHEIAYKPET